MLTSPPRPAARVRVQEKVTASQYLPRVNMRASTLAVAVLCIKYVAAPSFWKYHVVHGVVGLIDVVTALEAARYRPTELRGRRECGDVAVGNGALENTRPIQLAQRLFPCHRRRCRTVQWYRVEALTPEGLWARGSGRPRLAMNSGKHGTTLLRAD